MTPTAHLRAALEKQEWDIFLTLICGDAAHVRLTGDDARKAILEAMDAYRVEAIEEMEKWAHSRSIALALASSDLGDMDELIKFLAALKTSPGGSLRESEG